MTLCKTFSNIRISDIIISCLCLIGIVHGFCYDIRMLFPAIALCVWFSIKILKYIYPNNYKAKPIDHRTKEEKFEAVFNS